MKKKKQQNKRYILLSYLLSEKSPLYPWTPSVNIRSIKRIKKGNSCNTSLMTLSNHSGTHVDAPGHFWNNGRFINEYDISELIFTSPIIIECPKQNEELIEPQDLEGKITSSCDLLLIKTGFYKYRGKDDYCFRNPSLSPKSARWIRMNYANIRALGIDCISVSSFAHRELGGETHRILLQNSEFKGYPVLLIEDMNLSVDLRNLKEVMVVPFYIKGIDSAPCTVIGVLNENKGRNF